MLCLDKIDASLLQLQFYKLNHFPSTAIVTWNCAAAARTIVRERELLGRP